MENKVGFWRGFYNVIFRGKAAMWNGIFALLLVVFTCLLYRVSDQTAAANVATQRAFISFSGVGGQNISDPTGKTLVGMSLSPVWQNSGTTPGRDAISQVNWQVWPTDIPEGFTFPDNSSVERRKFVIGPKTPLALQMGGIPIEQFDQVRQRKFRLFVFGWVRYRDIFPDTPVRLTEFCSEIVNIASTKADMTDPTNNFSWAAQGCREYNCYDEECPDY
ncbi:hypothetical protein [Tunturiibacter gelidiferens]|uniref:MacB-like periplasmic core domain-containing protein n=1 Tax=Tunturiibacter gelidiferens TaxID=3069689 RepID=A0AAU7YYJ8_9BACT